jgi:hypothetical protein
MAADNEILWIVRRLGVKPAHYVFRTRQAAHNFRKVRMSKPRNRTLYTVPIRATWGPES